jgi:hypothetical protein
MTWMAGVLIVVMVMAGSKFVRHSLIILAAIASIGALIWLLVGHAPESRGNRSRFGLSSSRYLPH